MRAQAQLAVVKHMPEERREYEKKNQRNLLSPKCKKATFKAAAAIPGSYRRWFTWVLLGTPLPRLLLPGAEQRAEAEGVNEHHTGLLLTVLSLSHLAGQGHT